MHREVFGFLPCDPEHVDHETHNTLDNRRSNLRKTGCRGNHENSRDQGPQGPGVRRRRNGFAVEATINNHV